MMNVIQSFSLFLVLSSIIKVIINTFQFSHKFL